ncbi:ubiquitinyl hydrolase 1 [Malassezia vespertilionis]|uniref:Ubiquitin carboxyl-terminal hydrolase n=1 Tax=Malassezia vespertilionis TaxID=2020962 RepID=A0A2N1J9H5_9BASI|nr:ubiquitinyl hydrolase 1 [Malassezia vespertilionis]PKI83198.1 Ubp6p [Malassezia vespertilionis]WFD07870.1 ubiquitinyl hydrolase 1 [Malassezia vespertilionis]
MSSRVPIKVKHNGQTYDIDIDADADGAAFKQCVFEKTHVPVERQKVMVKGGLLKDDTPLSKLAIRAGQQFMVLGAAGDLPKAPAKPVHFLEDMKEDELAEATHNKVGLTNLGNTCYLNSTLQVLRCIPELHDALTAYAGSIGAQDGDAKLTASLRDLFRDLAKAQRPFPPLLFVTMLRNVAPQFAEMAEGGGYAQQDAEEVWIRIVNALGTYLAGPDGKDRFVPRFLTGHMATTRSLAETAEEERSVSEEPFLMLQCNISSSTNDMSAGILDTLTQKIEKHSTQLGRTAVYNEQSRIARLPMYLAVHFVRFYWRRDINKKTKIMRKVKFPVELDASVFATDELKERMLPASRAYRATAKEREERARVRKRAKTHTAGPTDESAPFTARQDGNVPSDKEEEALRAKELQEIEQAIDPDLRADTGCNATGLYELAGIVTHKGAAADAGHYISWVRKDDGKTQQVPSNAWYKFDDENASIVDTEKIQSLYGGGEDSVAYILLYRAKTMGGASEGH